ncbi:MAG: glycosyltransferase [Pseudomonadota bacterium]
MCIVRILHLITGLNNGGAEAVLFRLCTVPQDGFEHFVVSMIDLGVYGNRMLQAGIQVFTLQMKRGRISAKGILAFHSVLRLVHPDVIQTWMYHADLFGGVVAKITGSTPVVWGIHNSSLDKTNTSLRTRLVARCCAVISPIIPNAIVSCSETAACIHQTLGYVKTKICVVPNGYDLSQFIPDNGLRQRVRTEFNINQQEKLIGMVARWDPQKDHGNLFSALARLCNRNIKFTCLLTGPGMSSSNIELSAAILKYNLSSYIRLTGPRQDIPAIMNALDLHVLSSSYGEAFPNVVAEAMACGTPCVVTRVGDTSLIVGETGWLVPPRDSDALAHALQQALIASNDSNSWPKRQTECRNRIEERFRLDQMVRSYQRTWESVVK